MDNCNYEDYTVFIEDQYYSMGLYGINNKFYIVSVDATDGSFLFLEEFDDYGYEDAVDAFQEIKKNMKDSINNKIRLNASILTTDFYQEITNPSLN